MFCWSATAVVYSVYYTTLPPAVLYVQALHVTTFDMTGPATRSRAKTSACPQLRSQRTDGGGCPRWPDTEHGPIPHHGRGDRQG